MDTAFQRDLVAHQDFLRRLARELVGEESHALDLVQDANVVALTRPPSDPRSLRAWLTVVLRRLAHRDARSRSRRSHREAWAARPEAHAGGLDALDRRLDAQALLLTHLRRLPDEQREALLLRYAEGLSVGNLARRQGVPADTAKTRLRRGLAALRGELDRRYGGRRAWSPLLVGTSLSRPGTSSTEPALSPTGLGTGTLVASSAGLGKLALSAAVLIALIAFGATWIGQAPRGAGRTPSLELADASPSHEEPATLEGDREPVAARPTGEAPGLLLEDEPLDSEAHEASTVDIPPRPVPPGPTWQLHVRTRGASAVGAEVTTRVRFAEYGLSEPQSSGTLDAGGEARIDLGGDLRTAFHSNEGTPDEIVVKLRHPYVVPVEERIPIDPDWNPDRAPPRALEVVFDLRQPAIVRGRLATSIPGEHLGLVAAYVEENGRPAQAPSGIVKLDGDANGVFELLVDGEGPHVLLAHAVAHRPLTREVFLTRGSVTELGELNLVKGAEIHGTVVRPDGSGIANAQVHADLRGAGRDFVHVTDFDWERPGSMAWVDGRFELHALIEETDAKGRFRLRGLFPALFALRCTLPDQWSPFKPLRTRVRAPASGIELSPGATLALVIELPGTDNVNDGRLLVTAGDERHELDLGAEELRNQPERELALPPHTDVTVAPVFPGLTRPVQHLRTPGPGERIAHHFVLEREAEPAAVHFTFPGADVADGEHMAVRWQAEGLHEEWVDARVREGRLRLADLPPGRIDVAIVRGRDRFAPTGYWLQAELTLHLAPGELGWKEVTFERGGGLVVEAVDGDGQRQMARCTIHDEQGTEQERIFVANGTDHSRVAAWGMVFERGPSRAVPDLAPGRYRVTAQAGGKRAEGTVRIEPGRTATLVLTLE